MRKVDTGSYSYRYPSYNPCRVDNLTSTPVA